MNVKDLLEEAGYQPKRKAACQGGEYASPCPFCQDGDDRFIVWPNKSNSNGEYHGGRFMCRVCDRNGDAITFLRELHGLTYAEACGQLRIEPKRGGEARWRPVTPPPLPIAEDPPPLWQEKAGAFVLWCHTQLFQHPKALESIKARGITKETIDRFKIGYCPRCFFREREEWGLEPEVKENGNPKKLWLPAGVVIPTFSSKGCVQRIKIRRTEWSEGDKLPKYVEVAGSKRCYSIYGDTALPCALILESELDAMLVQQEADSLCFCVALGGSTKPRDRDTDVLLRKTPVLLFCPDYDEAGAVAFVKWKKVFPAIRRLLTPDGKSAGDAFIAGISLAEWIEAGLA